MVELKYSNDMNKKKTNLWQYLNQSYYGLISFVIFKLKCSFAAQNLLMIEFH